MDRIIQGNKEAETCTICLKRSFLKNWEPIRNGDACIIAQDEGFLEQVRQQWEKPGDWCGYQEEGHVVFRQVDDAAEAIKKQTELLKTLETEADYIWGQNYIREEYRSYAALVWKRLQAEAAEQGFIARYGGKRSVSREKEIRHSCVTRQRT